MLKAEYLQRREVCVGHSLVGENLRLIIGFVYSAAGEDLRVT